MLPSSKRLSIPLFKNVMDAGKLFHSPFFSAKFIKVAGMSRFSVAVSKKVAKKAVDRNKLRRQAYSLLRALYPSIQDGFHGVIMLKKPLTKGVLEEFFVKWGILK